jgi:threonyl-tRNA synthetase
MNKDELHNLRHTLAHLLAAAVLEFYPDAKRTIGPSIDDGFYFDFDFGNKKVSEDDLPKIEEKMREILPSWTSFIRRECSREEAKEFYAGNEYKHELVDEIVEKGEPISFYKSGDYEDLCRGGHLDNPAKEIDPKSFKLTSVAGAYWRGNENNKMLTRIYAAAFPTEAELLKHLEMIEEAKKRDHRKLGKELDLFTFSEHIGSGLPLYTPRGAAIRLAINNYVEGLQSKADYTQVWTPQIAKAELFKISGHYDKYKDDMFKVVSNYSEEEFYLKPMNCPQHTQIYASQKRSYRDLPLRYTDFAMLYRDERPGELSGLARVRSFSQDDCHIFCREDQVDEEIDKALAMTKEVMKTFGLKYKYRLSTRDPEHHEKYLGNPETWDKAEAWAEKIMKRNNIECFPGPGEAAFYAPKMDLIATDALGREWQLSTIQIDYVMPERFNLTYTDSDGKEKHPVMLHRAIVGSPERFMMILIEHYGGVFPLWLSPVQVKILPISEAQNDFAKKIHDTLKEKGVRVEIDENSDTLGKKISRVKMEKVPYYMVIGNKEMESGKLKIENRAGEATLLSLEDMVEKITKEISEKK